MSIFKDLSFSQLQALSATEFTHKRNQLLELQHQVMELAKDNQLLPEFPQLYSKKSPASSLASSLSASSLSSVTSAKQDDEEALHQVSSLVESSYEEPLEAEFSKAESTLQDEFDFFAEESIFGRFDKRAIAAELAHTYPETFASQYQQLQESIARNEALEFEEDEGREGREGHGETSAADQELLVKDKIYFDWAATCLLSKDLEQANREVYKFIGNPHRSTGNNAYSRTLKQIKDQLQQALGLQRFTPEQVLFTSGTTDALNLIVEVLQNYFQRAFTKLTSSVSSTSQNTQNTQNTLNNNHIPKALPEFYCLLGTANHHANLLPWLAMSEQLPFIKTLAIPLTATGKLDLSWLEEFVKAHPHQVLTVAVSTVNNVDGNQNSIKSIAEILNQYQSPAQRALIIADHAQGASLNQWEYFGREELEAINEHADFIICSGHKLYTGTSLGFLFLSSRVLDKFAPKSTPNVASTANLLANLITARIPTKLKSAEARSLETQSPELQSPNQENQQSTNLTAELSLFEIPEVYLEPVRFGGGYVKSVSWPHENYKANTYKANSITADSKPFTLQTNNPFQLSGTENYQAILSLKSSLATLISRDELFAKQGFSALELKKYFEGKLTQEVSRDPELVENFSDKIGSKVGFKLITDLSPVSSEFNFYLLSPDSYNLTSFYLPDGLAGDLASYLAKQGIITRVGKHCAYPLHQHYGIDESIRFSFSPYNTIEEIDICVAQIISFLKEYL